jgi:hypothetical protein
LFDVSTEPDDPSTCYDGTAINSCSGDLPWYCNASTVLVLNSSICGCPAGQFEAEDGSCTLYDHIKLSNLRIDYLNAGNASWEGAHTDLMFAHSYAVAPAHAANPAVMLFHYEEPKALDNTSQNAAAAFCLEKGCDIESFYYHYYQDYYINPEIGDGGWVYGYNASNPGVPPSRANYTNQSRFGDWWDFTWKIANMSNPLVNNLTIINMMLYYNNSNVYRVGTAGDNADNYAEGMAGINYTIEYWKVPAVTSTHPLTGIFFDMERDLITRYKEATRRDVRYILNARDPYWFFYGSFHSNYSTFADVQFETYSYMWHNDSFTTANPNYATNWLYNDVHISNHSRGGQRFYLQYFDQNQESSDRSKILALADYYLIKDPNLYFSYVDCTHGVSWDCVHDFASETWIPAVTYDIGQPMENSYSAPSWWSPNGPFNWSVTTDPYTGGKVVTVAREYDNALVLLRWRPAGNSPSNGSTNATYDMGSMFSRLNGNGTLEAPAQTYILKYNEGLILIKP